MGLYKDGSKVAGAYFFESDGTPIGGEGKKIAGAYLNGKKVFEEFKRQQFTLFTQDIKFEGASFILDRGVTWGSGADSYPSLGTITPSSFRDSRWFVHSPLPEGNDLFVVNVKGNKPEDFIERVTLGRQGFLQTFEVADALISIENGIRQWRWTRTIIDPDREDWGFYEAGQYIMVIYWKEP